MLFTRLRTSSRTWSSGIKTLPPNEHCPTARTYSGRRYYYHIPAIPSDPQNYSGERYRYSLLDTIASGALVGNSEITDIGSTQIALAHRIRS